MKERQRDSDRDRKTERQKERQRDNDRETERQKDRMTATERQRQTDRVMERQKHRVTERQHYRFVLQVSKVSLRAAESDLLKLKNNQTPQTAGGESPHTAEVSTGLLQGDDREEV